MPKVVFSSTLEAPLSWANTELVDGDPVEAVRAMKRDASRRPMRTARQPHPVPVAARGRPRGPLPRGRLPGHHRSHGQRAHLRRVPRRRPRAGRPAARSTAGCSCSSTSPRCSTDRLTPGRPESAGDETVLGGRRDHGYGRAAHRSITSWSPVPYGVGSGTVWPRMSELPKFAGHAPRTSGAGTDPPVSTEAR